MFAPWAWLVDNLILPNWTLFAWSVFVIEVLMGAFLLVGLATRLFGHDRDRPVRRHPPFGGQRAARMGVVLWLMIAAHLAVWATAAGRWYGLDGVLRPAWAASRHGGADC